MLTGSALALVAGTAHAVTCSSVIDSLGLTHVIYGSGGNAFTPTLAKVAYLLSKASTPITVFYADPGSQAGYIAFRDGTAGRTTAPFKYWLSAADVTSGTPPTCTADDSVAGRTVDFAVTAGSIALFDEPLPASVGAFTGPTQSVNVVVPKSSTENSVSTTALYFVYGFGNASQYGSATMPVPWIDKNYIFQRSRLAFEQQFIRGAIRQLGSDALNFPADFAAASTQSLAHSANGQDSNQGVVDSLVWAAAQGLPSAAIGFVNGATADKNRAVVRSLAYQHVGQTCGYWPDSTPDAFDKLNVRTGQYSLWDSVQLYARVTGSNVSPNLAQIQNPDLRNFVGYLTGGVTPPADADLNRAVSETGLIPQCAMRVKKDGDFGALSSYAPTPPCDCYFEAIATAVNTCDACTTDADCSAVAPKCRFGFCEGY